MVSNLLTHPLRHALEDGAAAMGGRGVAAWTVDGGRRMGNPRTRGFRLTARGATL